MKIEELLPIDAPPHLGNSVCEALTSYLMDFSRWKSKDTSAYLASVRIVAAFAALERSGDINEFKQYLLWKNEKT